MASVNPPVVNAGFFGDQWHTFVTGVQRMNPQDIRNVRDEFRRQQLPDDWRNNVYLPGWSDVIRLGNGYRPSRDQWREYYRARRDGRAPDLAPDVLGRIQELERDQQRRLGAAGAETAEGLGAVMNGTDNIQDLIVVIGLLGHLTVWLAPQVFGRMAPVVGQVLLAADLINLITLLGQLASPLWTGLCRGVAEGVAAVVPALVFGPELKGKAWRSALASPFSRIGRFHAPLGAFGKWQAFGLAVQLPQVTQSLFGWGVALGGLVGVATSGAAAGALAFRGDPVNFRMHPSWGNLNDSINRPLREDATPDLQLLQQCAHTLAMAPSVLRRPELFTAEEYCSTLVVVREAQRVVYGRLNPYRWQPIIESTADSPLPLASWPTWASAPRFEALGIGAGAPIPWDLAGHPFEATGATIAQEWAPAVAAGVGRFCGQWRNTLWGTFAGQLVNDITDEAWPQLMGEDRPIRWALTPDWALLSSLAESNRIPVPVEPYDGLWAFWQAAKRQAEDRPVAKWLGADWDRLAAQHGVKVMRLAPPDAPWPDEWRTWVAKQPVAPTP